MRKAIGNLKVEVANKRSQAGKCVQFTLHLYGKQHSTCLSALLHCGLWFNTVLLVLCQLMLLLHIISLNPSGNTIFISISRWNLSSIFYCCLAE